MPAPRSRPPSAEPVPGWPGASAGAGLGHGALRRRGRGWYAGRGEPSVGVTVHDRRAYAAFLAAWLGGPGRELPGRLVGHRRPHQLVRMLSAQPPGASPPSTGSGAYHERPWSPLAQRLRAPHPWPPIGQRPGPLRPSRRALQRHARPDDELLVRRVRAARGRHSSRGPAGQDRPALHQARARHPSTTWSRSGPAGAAWPSTPPAHYGCRVTTTTISDAQRRVATRAGGGGGAGRPGHRARPRLPRPDRAPTTSWSRSR